MPVAVDVEESLALIQVRQQRGKLCRQRRLNLCPHGHTRTVEPQIEKLNVIY
jgi:hypothetical protein